MTDKPQTTKKKKPSIWRYGYTAPTDGREFLGCWKTGVMSVVSYDKKSGEWSSSDDCIINRPMYWTPLPSPPKGSLIWKKQ